MDSSITAAGRALRAGDPLGALKRVALRDDPPALALRGIAMAQLGDLGARARAAAAGGARLRAARDGRAGALPDGRGRGGAGGARSRLAVAGAGRGAAHVRRARRSRERGPRAAAADPAPPAARADRRGGGRAARRSRSATGRRGSWPSPRLVALRDRAPPRAGRAGARGARPRARGGGAVGHRARCAPRSSTPAARWSCRRRASSRAGEARSLTLAEVEAVLASPDLVVDGCRRAARRGERSGAARAPAGAVRAAARAWRRRGPARRRATI